jgi:hypothetical protein
VIRIPQESHTRDARRRLFENLEPFRCKFVQQKGNARGIAARPGETRDEPELHRVGARGEHDGNGLRRLDRGRCDVPAEREHHIGLQTHEICGEGGETLRPALRIAVLNRKILPFDVAEVTQAAASYLDRRLVVRGAEQQHSQTRDPRLLRAGREQPRCRAAEKRG